MIAVDIRQDCSSSSQFEGKHAKLRDSLVQGAWCELSKTSANRFFMSVVLTSPHSAVSARTAPNVKISSSASIRSSELVVEMIETSKDTDETYTALIRSQTH